jgi:hypothetical protein
MDLRERERERGACVYVCMNEGDGGCTCIEEWGQKGKESGSSGKESLLLILSSI